MKIFLLFLAAFYAFNIGLALTRLRAFRWRLPGTQACAEDAIEPPQRAILDLPREWLASEGFRPVGWHFSEQAFYIPGQPDPQSPRSLFLSADGSIICTVVPSVLPQHGISYLLHFGSTLADGTEIVTANRACLLPMGPGIVARDDYLASDAAQLALHREQVGNRPCVIYTGYEDLMARSRPMGEKIFAYWQQALLQQDGNGGWQLSWKGAWAFMRLLQRHNSRMRRLPAPVPDAKAAEISSHAEREMLENLLQAENDAARGKNRVGLFLVTGLAFAGLGIGVMGYSWSLLLALMLVLLVHELGHFAAMKAFGYRQLGIFFLPLLGAAAQGKKDSAPPWQQLVILLAGPVPGMVAALLFVLAVTSLGLVVPPAFTEFALYVCLLALVVNFINLLPIMPLDGGRVTELLFFSRFPRASFAFFVAGVVALFALAVALRDPVSGFIALVLTLSLSFQWRLMQISRALQPHYGKCADQGQALELLAETFTHGVARSWLPMARLSIAKSLLPRLRGGLPGWPTFIVGTAVYFSLLLAPAIALVAADTRALSSPLTAIVQLVRHGLQEDATKRMERELANARTPEEKMSAHLNLYLMQPRKAEAAQQHLEAAYRFAMETRPISRNALSVLSLYINDLEDRDPAAAEQLVASTEAALEREADPRNLASWLQTKDTMLVRRDTSLPERIANHERALAILEKHAGDHDALYSREQLARLYFGNQQPERGLAVLQANWKAVQGLKGEERAYLRDSARSDLAWAYLRTGQPAAALEVFGDFRARPQPFAAEDADFYMYALLPEQTHAYVLLAMEQPQPALAAVTQVREAYRKVDPKDRNLQQVLALELDLLLAQEQAGQTAAADATRQRLKRWLDKSEEERESYLFSLDMYAKDPQELSAARSQEHLALLAGMGYHVPERSQSCTPEDGEEDAGAAEEKKISI